MGRRSRTRATSFSSTTSQSSMTSIYARINKSSPPADPTEGHTNVYGSFTTTIPATLWLRSHLTLNIPATGKSRAKQRDLDCGYDTPPDSPLSLFQSPSGSTWSPSRPSISRTLLTDFDWVASSHPTYPQSPSVGNDDNGAELHPVLAAVEKGSKLSCRTICSTCMRAGSNFPRCPRCHEMWCSRTCRLRGGKKHVCAIPKM